MLRKLPDLRQKSNEETLVRFVRALQSYTNVNTVKCCCKNIQNLKFIFENQLFLTIQSYETTDQT